MVFQLPPIIPTRVGPKSIIFDNRIYPISARMIEINTNTDVHVCANSNNLIEYTEQQKNTSTLLHTYVMNEYLTACSSD